MYCIDVQPVESSNLISEDSSCTNLFYHFLQTPFWASFKAQNGWKSYFFECSIKKIDNNDFDNKLNKTQNTASISTNKCYCSVLLRTFGRIGSIAYIPMGLELPNSNIAYNSNEYLILLDSFASSIKKYLPKNVFCVRLDPPIEFLSYDEKILATKNLTKLKKQKTEIQNSLETKHVLETKPVLETNKSLKIKKALSDIQPPDTVLLDITKDETVLLESMKQKWRYNVKLAEKKGVTVKACGAEAIPVFYDLYGETASRDGIAVHSQSYYKSLFDLPTENQKIKVTLYIAEYESEPLAGIITLFTGTEAVYLYGASSNSHRNLMPAYLLQWTAIKDAKAFGSKVYDFYGCPPTDDENHPMHGLFRFKNGFGGQLTHRIGSLDYPLRPIIYNAYTCAEKIRGFYYKKVKKLFKRK